MILITGAHKAFALYKAIEEGVSHMWTVSAFQQHPRTVFVCDEEATLELKVKTVKYFKGEGLGWGGWPMLVLGPLHSFDWNENHWLHSQKNQRCSSFQTV